MSYRNYKNKDLFKPSLLVFHQGGLPQSPGHGYEKPDRQREQPRSKSGVPLPTPSEGKESAETMPALKVGSFFVINPDVQKHKAPWKLLSRRVVRDPKTKEIIRPSSMQLYLRCKTSEERERFLAQPHIQAEIESEYARSKQFYANIPSTMKAPQITVNPWERPKLEYDGEMLFMGGSLSKRVSEEIGGSGRYIEGNDPVSLLEAIRSMPEEERNNLAGKPAIISFDPSIIKDVSVPQQVIAKGDNAVNKYLQQQAEGQYLAPMRDAVAELKKSGMKVIMINQLRAYGLDKSIYGQKNLRNRVARILTKSMCQMYLDGQIDAVVDAENGCSPSNIQIRPEYAATENGQPTLNAKGIKGLANGVIAGINFGVLNIPSENSATKDLAYYGLLDDGRERPNGNPEVEQYRKQMHVPMEPVSPETESFLKENVSDLLGRIRKLESQSKVPSLKDATKVADLTSEALLVERQTKDEIDWNRYFEFRRLVSSLFLKVANKAVADAEKQKGSAGYNKAVDMPVCLYDSL
jgi:hypothetical protein